MLITAGPTRAYLDRVRFLSNVSTGELGFLLCEQLVAAGCEVALVAGPSSFDFESLGLKHLCRVETNDEMEKATLKLCQSFVPDAAVFSAAVLDFAPAKVLDSKVKSKSNWVIKLKPTRKIIDQVGKKFPRVRRIGFKLEWKAATSSAGERDEKRVLSLGLKLIDQKKLEMLVLNFLSEIKGTSHPAVLFARDGSIQMANSKKEIAQAITQYLRGTVLA